jgi:protein transport protein SEC23
MDFTKNEQTNGVRWSWNLLPSCRVEQAKMTVPIGCMYTPLKEISGLPVLEYEPLTCKNCRSILNPYCKVDFRSKVWGCPVCNTKNIFPNAYSQIDENTMPAELYGQYTTVEYVLARKTAPPPLFLFVVDTCVLNEEMEVLRDSILRSIEMIPENATIGLVTFGQNVQVYELSHAECTKAYIFRGDKEPNVEQIATQLGLKSPFKGSQGKPLTPQQNLNARFLVPLNQCEVTLTSILEELQPDPWPIKERTRSKRCTGTALSIATALAEIGYSGFGARLVTFVGGPCTIGPGMVVGQEFKEQMRFHNDLRSDRAPHFKKSVEFYNSIAQRLVKNSHACDIFAANLDQCGVMEMRSCMENTGGDLLLTDSFDNAVFKQTYLRYFRTSGENLAMAFNGTIDVKCSPELRVIGAIGPVTSLNKQTPYVSTDNEIGYGKTSAWKINAFSTNTTVALYFDVVNQESNPGDVNNPVRYFQLVTQYQHANGQYRLRVTTQGLKWLPTNSWAKIGIGFDQDAATALVARWSAYKAETEHLFDVLRWLDRNLIRLIGRFGEYRKDDPNSLSIASNFTLFPQFMYHLRRSQFLRVFNTSPDETTFFRLVLNREYTQNMITMIQPTLFSYSLQEPPHAVLLDSQSVAKTNILLFDSFFHVLIHYGETIADWRIAKYQDLPEYKHFKLLLEVPKEDGKRLVKDRYPFPKVLETDQDGTDSRILLAKINPSSTHHSVQNQGFGENQGTVVLTDDASLQDFMGHLKKLAVEQQ